MIKYATHIITKSAMIFAAALLLQTSLPQSHAQAADPSMSNTQVRTLPGGTQRMEPSAPFSSKLERKPARAVVLDENIDAGTLQVLNYAGSIKRRTSDMVEVDVVLSKPEDERTLDLLANKIYMDNQGSRYQNVVINWYVGGNPQPNMPWATTNLTRTGGSFYLISSETE